MGPKSLNRGEVVFSSDVIVEFYSHEELEVVLDVPEILPIALSRATAKECFLLLMAHITYQPH